MFHSSKPRSQVRNWPIISSDSRHVRFRALYCNLLGFLCLHFGDIDRLTRLQDLHLKSFKANFSDEVSNHMGTIFFVYSK